MTDLFGVNKTMNMNRRWWIPAAAILTLAGCAAEGPVKPAGIEQKIEAARTRADHQDIAAAYEQQAEGDRSAAERYRGLARAYERGLVWSGPPVGSLESIRSHAGNLGSQNQGLAALCENLARKYQQAAEENLALAREHRHLATGAKD